MEPWASLPPDQLLAQIHETLNDGESPLLSDPPRLQRALPYLIPLLPQINPPSLRYTTAQTIGTTHPSSIKDLLFALRAEACTYRECYAGEYLSLIGPPAIPALIEGLCDQDANVRNLAGRTLRAMRLPSPPPARSLLRPLAHFAPPEWTGTSATLQPGDLTAFITPRGLQGSIHPLQDAPLFEAHGGHLYLDALPRADTFRTLLQALGIPTDKTQYAAFIAEASVPEKERYLVQLRLVSLGALNHVFGIYPDASETLLVQQEHSIGDVLWAFVGHQQGYWGTFFADPRAPQGAFGGDDEYAREELAFGLMVETPGIYRIWSRAWLVEK